MIRAAGCWLWRVMFRSLSVTMVIVAAGLGAGLALIVVVPWLTEKPTPIRVKDLHEVDGVVVRGGQLNLIGFRTGTSKCPASTQRYLWREIQVGDEPTTELVPLSMTLLPANLPNGRTMLTLPVPMTVSDGQWYYRAVTSENCSWLPEWFGWGEPTRGPDVPVRVEGK